MGLKEGSIHFHLSLRREINQYFLQKGNSLNFLSLSTNSPNLQAERKSFTSSAKPLLEAEFLFFLFCVPFLRCFKQHM